MQHDGVPVLAGRRAEKEEERVCRKPHPTPRPPPNLTLNRSPQFFKARLRVGYLWWATCESGPLKAVHLKRSTFGDLDGSILHDGVPVLAGRRAEEEEKRVSR